MKAMRIAVLVVASMAVPLAHADRAGNGPRLVATHTASAGETMDGFAASINAASAQLTATLHAEVCGEFRMVNGVYSIDLYTLDQQQVCAYARSNYGYVGEAFHTYLHGLSREFTPAELERTGYISYGRSLWHLDGKGRFRWVGHAETESLPAMTPLDSHFRRERPR